MARSFSTMNNNILLGWISLLPEAVPILVTNSFFSGSLMSLMVRDPLGPDPGGSKQPVSFNR